MLLKLLGKLKRNWLFQVTMPPYAAAALSDPQWGDGALALFGRGLHGSLPTEKKPLYLLVACDEIYFRTYGIAFILSVEATGDSQSVHLHLIGPSQAALREAEDLASELTNVSLSITWDDASLAAQPTKPKFYYSAVRFVVTHFLIEATGSPILCLDVDGLAIRPIRAAYERWCSDGDVGLLLRLDNPRIWYRTRVGAVAFNPSRGGRTIVSAAARMTLACLRKRPNEHVDQAIFYHIYVTTQQTDYGIKWFPMPRELLDNRFGADATFWPAKGLAKQDTQFRAALSETLARRLPRSGNASSQGVRSRE